jgi:hypothetical protein
VQWRRRCRHVEHRRRHVDGNAAIDDGRFLDPPDEHGVQSVDVDDVDDGGADYDY